MNSVSPLRYPGGKARFSTFIAESILGSGEQTDVFVEPFCGGAGASIKLLENGFVPQIALNDVDPLIASFWQVVFGKSRSTRHDIGWLLSKIESCELTVQEWRVIKASNPKDVREAAWKCLYLNRTSFNGIIHKAGPIGGWGQKNRSIAVRFNKEKLSARLNELYKLREHVTRVDCVNWKRFCSFFTRNKSAYLYLDPPYYHKAEQLYGFVFDEKTHQSVRDYLLTLKTPWMLSYDDAPEVRLLYANKKGIQGRVIDQTYSAHPVGGNSFVGRELFFSNRRLPIQNEVKHHIGLTVVGCFKKVGTKVDGPVRVAFERTPALAM